jgi:epoxyqueuosine reductase
MKSEQITEKIYTRLKEKQIRGKTVSVSHLEDLKKEIERFYKGGEFDRDFYEERLREFDYSLPKKLPGAKTLIIVAAPQLQIRVAFRFQNTTYHLIIPPTYLYNTDRRAENILRSVLKPEGYGLAGAKIPEKILAARSGLAKYGKNNITYVTGMGSFNRPSAFFTDLPCLEDSWGNLEMMEDCLDCSACLKSCPSGAITRGRFLVRAERCLTFHNERQVEFPEWINPSWHNCLIGCMACQLVCPANREFLGRIEDGPEFSAEETGFILQGKPKEELPVETVKKLKRINMLAELKLLPRNLRVLF